MSPVRYSRSCATLPHRVSRHNASSEGSVGSSAPLPDAPAIRHSIRIRVQQRYAQVEYQVGGNDLRGRVEEKFHARTLRAGLAAFRQPFLKQPVLFSDPLIRPNQPAPSASISIPGRGCSLVNSSTPAFQHRLCCSALSRRNVSVNTRPVGASVLPAQRNRCQRHGRTSDNRPTSRMHATCIGSKVVAGVRRVNSDRMKVHLERFPYQPTARPAPFPAFASTGPNISIQLESIWRADSICGRDSCSASNLRLHEALYTS